jgi:outer membrane protein OmpA-like peptidoglycan-associated protein
MLTAIQDFLADSFTDGGQELETVDAGRFKLWLTYGPKLLLVGAVSGTAPLELKQKFRKTLDQIEEALQNEISQFKQGDTSVFEPAMPFLQACLLGQSAPDKQQKARLWPYLLALAILLVGVFGYRAYERGRWNDYFAALKTQPGIVVTDVERHGSAYKVTGLRDPAAADPAALLRMHGLDARKATFALQPYLSLDPQFAGQRELIAAKDSIETRIIRFDPGSSKLASSEADRIDDIMALVRQLIAKKPNTTITITGRADETGTGETNDKLALDRANGVRDAFIAQGIAVGAITVIAAGNRQPLRTGTTDWDRAVNRSVSFTVNTNTGK